MNSANLFALLSALCFSSASVAFAHYASRISVFWMTAFKAVIALAAFGVTAFIFRDPQHRLHLNSVAALVLSGFIGLNIGDLFLVQAFKRMGSARTLMIFSFEPIFLALFGYLFFSQAVGPKNAISIFILIACAFTLAYEKFKADGKWEIRGPLFAITATLLDCTGIVLSRYAFNLDGGLSTSEGNFFRCLGAVVGFVIISFFYPLHLWKKFKTLSMKSKNVVIAASLLGTFASLSLYLASIRYGHLATVSALLGAGPVFAATIESVVSKKRPSIYLMIALGLFVIGLINLFTTI